MKAQMSRGHSALKQSALVESALRSFIQLDKETL